MVPASAQTWPARAVRIIVPFAPGGGIDALARALAQKLTEQTGATFVVDNRPGAGGVLEAELVARAKPDGHTLLVAGTEFGINPVTRPKLQYDPFKDFIPVSQLVTLQNMLASHTSVPATNVKEFIALAKARPAQLTYGSSGTGGGPHLAGELFQSMAGIRWVHVPFKGAGPASIAVMGGEIDFMFSSTAGLAGHVRTGKLRAIAVTGDKHVLELPDVPTIAESGVPGYSVTGWNGLCAPAGLPPELVRRIHAEAARALGTPDVKDMLARSEVEPVMSSPEEFGGFLRAEIAKWTKVVRESGIRIE
jgi:tripartite-type tricarboxylate transporter receptor subunit TctC